MANLKEIQTRISSVKTTRQVTSAMKMVSASKLKRAQDNITRMRPYAEKLQTILQELSQGIDVSDSCYYEQRDPEHILIVLVSSNKGLCGAFNANIAKKTIEHAQVNYNQQFENGNIDFLVIGKQATKLLKSRGVIASREENEIIENLDFEVISMLAIEFMDAFTTNKYDRIDIVYNKFVNVATQIPTVEQFLPIKEKECKEESNEDNIISDFIFEPSKKEIVEKLIPQSLRTQFFKVFTDSAAAEHGARMTSMTQATDNATTLIQELTLKYNKARQTAITNQIIEVTGGAEALK